MDTNKTKSKKPKTTHVPYQHEHIQYEPITPDFVEQIQAVWRVMLRRNPRFNKYFNKDGARYTGINDTNFTTGGVAANTGKDYSYDAYKAYWYTYDTVTLRRMAFAFWSLVPEGPNAGLYAWANSDIEPLISDSRRAHPTPKEGDPKKDSDPTPAHCRDVYLEAYALYCEWLNLANFKDHILVVFLEESSPNHYHVGALFTRFLTEAEHDELVIYTRSNCDLKNLDKDTTSKRNGLGDMYRAPCTWKDGVQSRIVKFWCRGKEQLLARAAELAPPPRTKKCSYLPTNDPTDRATLLKWAIRYYPITPHTRDKVQGRLILALLNRGVDPEIIKSIIPEWLDHFNNQATEPDRKRQNFKTKPERAIAYADKCVDYVVSKSTALNIGQQPSLDYHTFVTNYRLTNTQRHTIGSIVGTQNSDLFPPSIEGGNKSETMPTPASTKAITAMQNWCVVEAIVIAVEICMLQKLDVARFTHEQILGIIRSRHNVEIDPRQFRNIKFRFCSFKLTNGTWSRATIVELLSETLKGTPGLSSEYQIMPILNQLSAYQSELGVE